MNRRYAFPDRIAVVTFKGQPAGELRELEAGARFLYRPGWTETIACSLPVDIPDHHWRKGLHPFFEHLAPEGWLRARQARKACSSDQDDLGLLLAYGADCIGAVGVHAGGEVPPTQFEADLLEASATVPGRTLSGVQKKVLAHRGEGGFLPSHRPDDPATHIAKLNPADTPTLVHNEHISLTLAREVLGTDAVTKAQIATVCGIDGVALLVERFDRRGSEKLRLEDFAQILGKPRGREFDGKYDSSYEEAASVVREHSARPLIDLERFFRLVVFNLAIGNADAHLKNFSLLERDEGLRLSPAYDLVCTQLYPFDADTGLAIGGRKRPLETIDRVVLEAFGTGIGLPSRAVRRALDQVAGRFAQARSPRALETVAPGDFRDRYRERLEANLLRIFR